MSRSLATKQGTVFIREANLGDVVQFRELRLFALQDSPTAFSADYEVNANHPMSFWESRLKPDEHGTIFVAEHNSQLVGLTGIRKGESPKTKHNALIWGVFVRPPWRGLHLAEELITTCIEWAKARDVEIVKLGVMTDNTPAIRCYERCGFTVYGTEPRGIFYEGKYYDEYLMYKILDE
ncbi:MAG: GNAT family N-acetyltransferase [Anaerolineales bacterium]|nr:GNAT family N-acetyltransferase [Anaerolineales bacterium]